MLSSVTTTVGLGYIGSVVVGKGTSVDIGLPSDEVEEAEDEDENEDEDDCVEPDEVEVEDTELVDDDEDDDKEEEEDEAKDEAGEDADVEPDIEDVADTDTEGDDEAVEDEEDNAPTLGEELVDATTELVNVVLDPLDIEETKLDVVTVDDRLPLTFPVLADDPEVVDLVIVAVSTITTVRIVYPTKVLV